MKTWVKVVLIIIAVVVVLVVGVVACGLGTLGAVANATNDAIEEYNNSVAESETIKVNGGEAKNGIVNVKVGDIIEFETFKMTIVDSERAMKFEYANVPNGYEIVRVGFEVENIGAEEDFFYNDFEAYCDGKKCDEYWGGDDDLGGGDLGAGRKMSGSAYFIVPENEVFEIEYHPFIWNETNTYIIIEVQ